MAAVIGIPNAWFFSKKSKTFRIGLLGFVISNYCFETGSMTGILEKLKLKSLKKKRRDSRLILLYKDLKGAASIPTDGLILPSRNHPSFRPPLQELTFTRAHSSLKQ